MNRGSCSDVVPWSHMRGCQLKTLSWIVLPSTSFSSSYSCPKSFLTPLAEYTRQLSHLLGLTTGIPAITMEKFSFQKWVITAVQCINLPHIPQNEHHAEVLADRYGVSFNLNLSSLSQGDISGSVKQTSSSIHFRCAVDFCGGSFRLYLATLSASTSAQSCPCFMFHVLFMTKPTCQ